MPTDKSVRINVVGLKPLQTALRQLEGDPTWQTGLKDAGRKAAEIVASEARSTASAGYGRTFAGKPFHMGSAAVATIRSLAGQLRATVALGKAAILWAGGAEFGSHGGPGTRQFPGAKHGGYNLYPAIARKRPQVLESYADSIDALMKQYGLE